MTLLFDASVFIKTAKKTGKFSKSEYILRYLNFRALHKSKQSSLRLGLQHCSAVHWQLAMSARLSVSLRSYYSQEVNENVASLHRPSTLLRAEIVLVRASSNTTPPHADRPNFSG